MNPVSLLCLFMFIPLLLGFIYHVYVRVRYTGVGTGTGGYYLFIIWPVLGCFAAYCFRSNFKFGRSLVFVAFGCLLVFEVIGEWRLIQLYSGILVKVGWAKVGIGGTPLTYENLLLVLGRLELLVFPYTALGFYLLAFVTKFAMVGRICFRTQDNINILRT